MTKMRSTPTRLRELREQRGLTQDQLGEPLGWTRSQVSKRESGRIPLRIDEAEKLASALNCRTSDLLESSNSHLDLPEINASQSTLRLNEGDAAMTAQLLLKMTTDIHKVQRSELEMMERLVQKVEDLAKDRNRAIDAHNIAVQQQNVILSQLSFVMAKVLDRLGMDDMPGGMTQDNNKKN